MADRAKFKLSAVALLLAGFLAGFLAGCSSPGSGESKLTFMSVPPGRYINYTCPQLEVRVGAVMSRRKVLEQLMAKAGNTMDGRLIGAMAYQTEYAETGGDLAELRRVTAEKECKPIAELQKTAPAR